MRLMLQAAAILPFLSVLVSAYVLPPSPSSSTSSTSHLDITTVAGTTDPDHVSINFKVPCVDCFIGVDNDLELELDINTSESECSGIHPRLNGVPLHPIDGTTAPKGTFSFSTKLHNGLGQRQIEATWEHACLNGQASIISIHFHNPSGNRPDEKPSGFAASFRQQGQPSVLRLQAAPIKNVADNQIHESWLEPADHQKVVVLSPDHHISLSSPDALQHELHKLDVLKSKVVDLEKQIHESEAAIMSLFKAQFKQCHTWSCLFQTVRNKMPEFTQLIATHFRHHPHSDIDIWKHIQHKNCTRGSKEEAVDIMPTQTPDQENIFVEAELQSLSLPPPPPPPQPPVDHDRPPHHDVNHPPPPPPPPPSDHDHKPHHHDGHPPPPPPFDDDHRPPWAHHPGDRPPPPNNPPQPPYHKPDEPPFGQHDHNRPHFKPFSLPPPQQARLHLILAVFVLLCVVTISGLLFIYLRRRKQLFRDPRRRVDRAARREERQARRLYKKAACKHKWSKWWNSRRQAAGNSDYEEKRQMILDQEGVLEDVMQREIDSLRTAHELVGELVRAEEGRARLYYEANLPPSQRGYTTAELEAGIGPSSRRTDSLPPYSAPPPTYEEELAGDLTVVDGFQGYTPSNTDDTPDSSIIDCTPRLSFETQETVFTKRYDDDEA